ncbi:MAG: hypothetical protein L7F78_14060, partial [Syntrophales bacterium LBB04]|nr:hypothetical protein [Syntrophales bacterium LBB04]
MEKQKIRAQEPRPASTVVLTREHAGKLQIYLLKRSPQSSFFPGNYVFPGGAVGSHDRDASLWGGHVDMSLEEIASRFDGNLNGEEILSYGVSAIRETFEEAGVFLGHGMREGDRSFEKACEVRASHELPAGWLREWVENGSWTLGFSMLARWAHWITPEGMPRRFDTRFFIASMPAGQSCVPDLRETTEGIWVSPEQALVNNLRGEIPLSPPTLVTLHELLPYSNMEDLSKALEKRSWGEPLLPRVGRLPRGAGTVEPWDPMYSEEFEIDEGRLEGAVPP